MADYLLAADERNCCVLGIRNEPFWIGEICLLNLVACVRTLGCWKQARRRSDLCCCPGTRWSHGETGQAGRRGFLEVTRPGHTRRSMYAERIIPE